MSRRASRPLNQQAVQAADDEIYRRHENDPRPNPLYDANGNRTPLSATDPSQAALRTEWMDLYVANGGRVEGQNPAPTPDPPNNPSGPCPPPPPPPAYTDPPGDLSVHLLHRCDGSPLNGGTVRISGPETREAQTGADGWAHFTGLTPGSYTIDGTHPQHHPGSTSAAVVSQTSTQAELRLDATIQIAPAQAAYTVVLDKNGNPTAAFPKLIFQITNGPPNHLFDVQLSRSGAPSGGPGIAGAWAEADGRDARMNRQTFSSVTNGQTTLRLDGGGNATFEMPLEWWRDQARTLHAGDADYAYQVRVVAFQNAAGPVCANSSVGNVPVRNNQVRFRVVDNGYTDGGLAHSIRMEFTVREANTTEMYTFVQWMQGSFQRWSGTPPVLSYPTHQLYDIIHDANFPDFTIDRLHTEPRYWDGNYNISGDGLTASATDAPSGGALDPGESHGWDSIDFETRVHLNFEVPAAVNITRQDGSAPVYGVVTGSLVNPQPVTMGTQNWNTRVLQVRQADGTVPVTHPNTFAGP
jgi:hypothetical protein